ncbi:hypothetical protein [Nonomuraea polychroma]|uniref:hypothetical protein n=1 Tax=Nonomuraea polychroma TaxID=46176 RepID=UPI0013E37598|nr:hypothetical protein [Nonomuraea polychroma]
MSALLGAMGVPPELGVPVVSGSPVSAEFGATGATGATGAPGSPVLAELGVFGVLGGSVVSAWSAGVVQSTADMAASVVALASKDRSLTVSSDEAAVTWLRLEP